MRLDKFVGKASYGLTIDIYDNFDEDNRLFHIPDGSYYPYIKNQLKKYKVKFYRVADDKLFVIARKKKED